MKKILYLALLSTIYICARSQAGKTTIGLTPFRTNGYNQYEPGIYDAVAAGFQESGRFNIVDRAAWGSIQKERELQKTEEFIDGQIAEQGKSVGAESIVVGSINNITTAKQNIVRDNVIVGHYYTASTSVSLKVVNVETGQSSNAISIRANSPFVFGGIGGAPSPEAAIVQTYADLKKQVKRWVGQAFPVKVKLVKVLEESDNMGVSKFLISGGSNAGISFKNDMRVVIYEDLEIDGKKIPRTVDIALARAMKIADENFSECKVVGAPAQIKKGGLAIREKMNEGKPIYVITTE